MKNLGLMHQFGRDGVFPADGYAAMFFYERAALLGNRDAYELLSRLLPSAVAPQWLAAYSGDASAQAMVAHHYSFGLDAAVVADATMAFYWYQRGLLQMSLLQSMAVPRTTDLSMRDPFVAYVWKHVRTMVEAVHAVTQSSVEPNWAMFLSVLLMANAPCLPMDRGDAVDGPLLGSIPVRSLAVSALHSLPRSQFPGELHWDDMIACAQTVWRACVADLNALVSGLPELTAKKSLTQEWPSYTTFSPFTSQAVGSFFAPTWGSCATQAGDLWVHRLDAADATAAQENAAHALAMWFAAAQGGSLEGMRCLGMSFAYGLRDWVQVNMVLAAEWFSMAAMLGDTVSLRELEKLVTPAIAGVFLAACRNNAEAQFLLAIFYEQGPVVPAVPSSEEQTCVSWTQPWREFVLPLLRPSKSSAVVPVTTEPTKADRGSIVAAPAPPPMFQRRLSFMVVPEQQLQPSVLPLVSQANAQMFEHINWPAGVVRFVPASVYWLERAVQSQHSGAKNNLACLLQRTDPVRAFALLAEAANAHDCSMAMYNFGLCYEKGVPGVVESNVDEAVRWFQLASDQGVELAYHGLQRLKPRIEASEGEIDQAKIPELVAAAEGGDPIKMSEVGTMFFFGKEPVRLNYTKARAWFERAAYKDHGPSLNFLGVMADNGMGVPRDARAALHFFEKAASLNDASALKNLALIYQMGRPDIDVDMAKSLACFEKAASLGNAHAQEMFLSLVR
jgi:TPR repeat protein